MLPLCPKFPKKIASEIAENCPCRQSHCRLTPPPDRGNPCEYLINLMLPERGDWKCRTGKWRTIEKQGVENAGLEFGGPNSRAGNCRTGKCRTGKCRTGKCKTGKCRTKRFRFLAANLCVLYRVLVIACFNVCFLFFCVQFSCCKCLRSDAELLCTL